MDELTDEYRRAFHEVLGVQKCPHAEGRKATECVDCAITLVWDSWHEYAQRIRGTCDPKLAGSLALVVSELYAQWPYRCDYCADHEHAAVYVEHAKNARTGQPEERQACETHAKQFLTEPIERLKVPGGDMLLYARAMIEIAQKQLVQQQSAASPAGP